MNNPMINTALAYTRSGIPVFPCKPADKTPYTVHGFKDASTDEPQILSWWATWPDAMIGVPTGKVSSLWVLDVDTPKNEGDVNGFASLASLVSTHGELPHTWMQQSPKAGLHYFFSYPQDGLGVPSSVNKVAPKLDVRGDGGYIIVAPSVNGDGIAYRTMNQVSVAYAPEWLVDLARQRSKPALQTNTAPTSNIPPAVQAMLSIVSPYAQKALDEECAKVTAAQEGSRNSTLNKAAFALGTLVGSNELDEGIVRSRLTDATTAMQNPLPAAETAKTIDSGMTAGKQHPRAIPELAAPPSNVSEESIASAFATRYKDTLRFCKDWSAWLEWNPRKHIWETDTTSHAFHYIREECKAANPENKPSIGKAATAAGVEKFARADPLFATTNEHWDQHIFLLGTPSGTINLKP